MLTRSKQRAIAATFQSGEGQGDHEGSALEMKLPAGWTELPAELLMMMFDTLTFTQLLKCRLVNPRWKSAVDDILERRRLSRWKNGIQYCYRSFQVPVVQFNPTGKLTVENVRFPSFLLGGFDSCTFPTKSVYLTTSTPETVKENWIVSPKGDAHFFSKFGHHLTSLTIEDQNRRKDFTALTLKQLLSCTPHLKAMTLEIRNIKLLKKDVGEILLPPLPHLQYVALGLIFCRGFEFDVQNWILEPYKEQLIVVKCLKELGCRNRNSPSIFPLLKQLKMLWPTRQQLLSPRMFPSLQNADLTSIELKDRIGFEQITLYHVFKFVSGVASTLVELHLDLEKERRSKINPINYEKDQQSLQELREIHQSRFPALKLLGITYPKYEEEVKVVKDFLKMFPNLETLNFAQFEIYPRNSDPKDRHRTAAREHLNADKYQELCPKLRIISVYVGMESSNSLVTSQYPFST